MIAVFMFGCMMIMFLGYVTAVVYVDLHAERRVRPLFK